MINVQKMNFRKRDTFNFAQNQFENVGKFLAKGHQSDSTGAPQMWRETTTERHKFVRKCSFNCSYCLLIIPFICIFSFHLAETINLQQVVELNGYVIIVVEGRDNKIKLYGSPADKDNLEVGDEILDVNERKLEDLPRAEVIRYIHEVRIKLK